MELGIGTFLLPLVDPDTWAKRHSILPFETPCTECGVPKVTSIPIASGRLRGLAAPLCSCGSESNTYCVVYIDGDILEWMGQ
jgi:hypothetical protein